MVSVAAIIPFVLEAQALSVGCLAKPYSQRDLLDAIEAVDARLAGREPKRMPRGLSLYGQSGES